MPTTSRFSSRKLYLIVAGLPLLLVLAGCWQAWRASSEYAASDAAAAYLAEAVAGFKEAQKAGGDPDAPVIIYTGEEMGAGQALSHYRDYLENAAKIKEGAVLRALLASAAIAFAVLGLLIGLFGLLRIAMLGSEAQDSPEALAASCAVGKKLLPRLIAGTGFCLIAAALCAIAYETLNVVSGAFGEERHAVKYASFMGLLALSAALLGCRLLWKIFKASRAVFVPEPLEVMGTLVSEERSPALWKLVRQVAEKTGAPAPDAVILGFGEGFFVTEMPVVLLNNGPVPSGRVLHLPLLYLAFMEEDEARAVIGHELAHFSGEEVELGGRVAAIYATAEKNLGAVAEAGEDAGGGGLSRWMLAPALMLGLFFLERFSRAALRWRRQREFEADKAGAMVAGEQAMALALLRITVLAPLLDRLFLKNWNTGRFLERGLLRTIIKEAGETGLDDPRERLEDVQPHPMDSHPPTRERIEALGVVVDDALAARVTAARPGSFLDSAGIGFGEAVREKSKDAGLGRMVDEEVTAFAGTRHALEEAALFMAAGQGLEETAVYEGGLKVLLAILVCAGIGIGWMVIPPFGSLPFFIGLTATALLLALAAALLLRRRHPAVILDKDGFRGFRSSICIPWNAVEAAEGAIVSGTLLLTVRLAAAYDAGASRKDGALRLRAKKRTVTLGLSGTKGMPLKDFYGLFTAYWEGAQARAALDGERENS